MDEAPPTSGARGELFGPTRRTTTIGLLLLSNVCLLHGDHSRGSLAGAIGRWPNHEEDAIADCQIAELNRCCACQGGGACRPHDAGRIADGYGNEISGIGLHR